MLTTAALEEQVALAFVEEEANEFQKQFIESHPGDWYGKMHAGTKYLCFDDFEIALCTDRVELRHYNGQKITTSLKKIERVYKKHIKLQNFK